MVYMGEKEEEKERSTTDMIHITFAQRPAQALFGPGLVASRCFADQRIAARGSQYEKALSFA